jgi:hypothetical protein
MPLVQVASIYVNPEKVSFLRTDNGVTTLWFDDTYDVEKFDVSSTGVTDSTLLSLFPANTLVQLDGYYVTKGNVKRVENREGLAYLSFNSSHRPEFGLLITSSPFLSVVAALNA